MKYIVYQTTNITNNKIYIGVHKCIDPEIFDGYIGCGIRVNNPSSYMNPMTPLQFAVKKYGTKSFKRVVLSEFNSAEEAFNVEKSLVNQTFISRKDTYNAKIGGLGGSSYFVKVNQYDLKGNLLKKWDSILEASDFYAISDTAIHNSCKFKGSCIKYFWSKEDSINIKEYTYITGQTCYKYTLEGKYVEVYNSFPEAAKDNNTNLQSIQRSIKGGYRVGDFYYSTTLVEIFKAPSKISLRKSPLYVYGLKGDFIIKLCGTKEICEYFNIKSTSSITTAIRTGRQYKMYQFSLTFKNSLEAKMDKRNIKKSVGQYTMTGDLIKTFDSITKACDIFGTGVQKVLRGQQKQCKNFIFKYLN